MTLKLFLFLTIWTLALYLFNCLVAKRLLDINIKRLLLYVSAVIFAGMYAEIVIDTVYNFFFGQPLWEYRIFPIHSAYTSYFSLAVWGLYGFHIYLLHGTLLKKKINSDLQVISILTIESIVFEILANLTFLIVFGEFIFYYLPNDLWHLTSIQVLPFYILGAFLIVNYMKLINRFPERFIIVNSSLILALLLIAR